jgi:hypothetical protein
MKKIIPFSISLLLFLALSLSACDKCSRNVVVVKDCTGSYIRIDQKDYLVCNFEVLQSYTDGAEIQVEFQKITNCVHLGDPIICEMYHPNEGFIEITKIK